MRFFKYPTLNYKIRYSFFKKTSIKSSKFYLMSYPFNLKPLSEEEYKAAAAEFARIDKNRNGKLDLKELEIYISLHKPELRSFPRLIIHIFGDGESIDWTHFYYSYRSFSASPDDDENYIGKKIFDYIDKDKSGIIDSSEFNKVLEYIDVPNGQLEPFILVGALSYPQFKVKFYEMTTLIWRSSFFKGHPAK